MDSSSLDSSSDILTEEDTSLENYTCISCKNQYMCPLVLDCLHEFCEKCILQHAFVTSSFSVLNIICPTCSEKTTTELNHGALALPQDYISRNILEVEMLKSHKLICKACIQNKEVTHKCINCRNYLCPSCESTHKMRFTLGQCHYIVPIDELIQNAEDKTALHRMILCEKHKYDQIVYYCDNCNDLACTKCLSEPSVPTACEHSYDSLSNAYKKYETEIEFLVRESENVMYNVSTFPATIEKALTDLQASHDQVKSNVEETFQNFKVILETCKKDVLVELESAQKQQQQKITDKFEELKETADNIGGVQQFATRLMKNGSESENMALKKLIFTRMQQLFGQISDVDVSAKISYNPGVSGFEKHCRKYFGHIETEPDVSSAVVTPAMLDSQMSNLTLACLPPSTMSSPCSSGDLSNAPTGWDGVVDLNNLHELDKRDYMHIYSNNIDMCQSSMSPLALNPPGLDPFSDSSAYSSFTWSPATALTPGIYVGPTNSNSYSIERKTPFIRPIPRHYGRANMHVIAKFGHRGHDYGQFLSPSGFCLSPAEDIVVADSLNHRIQVFGKDGTYKTAFGARGMEDGYLFNPRRVVFLSHDQIVICDGENHRSRIQIFEYPTGNFIKKMEIKNFLMMAGVAVTADGHLALVDCLRPMVCVLNVYEDNGTMKWFDCARYLEEPTDLAIRDEKYYVCDFKRHSVVVFNNEGVFLRRIGGQHITTFPIGIDISENGKILVGDYHGNRFHVAVFSHDGTLLADLECPYVYVSRCTGLKITSEGHIVTLAKKNHEVIVLYTSVSVEKQRGVLGF